MKKKLYLLALSTLLIGCTNKNSSTPVLDSSIESSSYRSYAETTEDITFCPKEFADFNLTYEINDSIVNEYNATQGRYDGVHVNIEYKSDQSANHTPICGDENKTDILYVNDRFFYSNTSKNYYTNLEPFINNESKYTVDNGGNRYLDISDFNSNTIDRFRFNTETLTAGKGEPLYGLPIENQGMVIYYKVDALKAVGVNFISITENELDNYNKEHNTSYAPRGYCEYLNDPSNGQMTSSKNLDNKTVYKVFNNRIPMSVLEMVTLSKQLTKSYNPNSITNYGYCSEYYQSHIWSVGGNTIHFDEDMNQYKFTLGDKQKNYLVTGTDSVEVNGTTYHEGEILSYKDRKFINNGGKSSNDSKLVKLPSSYEQLREFVALSQDTDKLIDEEMYGYKVSPSPEEISSHPVSSYNPVIDDTALLIDSNVAAFSLEHHVDFNWDMAPVYTYREFEGEDPKGTSTLKIVGEDGFTGKLREVNGTKIKGIHSAPSVNAAYVIPNNSTHKESAWKFLQYLTSKENQKNLSLNDEILPTRESVAFSNEYLNHSDKNVYALSMASMYSKHGEWSYLENGSWIDPYLNELNTDVKNGKTTITDYLTHQQDQMDTILKTYKFKLHGLE